MGLPAIVSRIQDGWENIQSFNIKTNSSISLPIWACDLGRGEGARWKTAAATATAGDGEWSGFGASNEEEVNDVGSERKEESPSVKPASSQSKGKKRVAEDDNESPVRKVKKDAKAADGSKKSSPTTQSSVSAAPPTISPIQRPSKNLSKFAKAGDDEAAPTAPVPAAVTTLKTTSPPSKSVLSQEDLKRKRSLGGLEGKKQKITKGKMGKSAKESILGSPVKARV